MKDIFRYLLISFCGRVDAVFLHGAGRSINSFEQKRQQRKVVFAGEVTVDAVELLDVIGAVVGRQRDSGEHHFDFCLEQRGYDLIHILPG